ncbi:MAG: GNAT family N-acetyltransferase [Hyphomicrobiales bacterium]
MSKITSIGGGGGNRKPPKEPKAKKPKKKSKVADAPEAIELTVTYLEMFAEPLLHIPMPNQKIALIKAENPPVHYSRYLYDIVGQDYVWVDRKRISDAELVATIHDDDYETFVLFHDGNPAGFFELDCRQQDEVELAYFGMFPEATGLGLGRYLLAQAIKSAWAHEPKRVHVETCTLDHPAALPLYQKLGFTPYKQVEKEIIPIVEP